MIRCPRCGKLVAVRFPVHECVIKRQRRAPKAAGNVAALVLGSTHGQWQKRLKT